MLDDKTRREIEASRDPRDYALGHPTVPGQRDEYELRMGGPSPGNGQPGVPKIWPGRDGTMGVLGDFGHPSNGRGFYDNPFGDDDDST